jgi:uncharacterized membrane protein
MRLAAEMTMTKMERWGTVIAGGVLLVSGLARRSILGIGMAGVGVALIRFATRRIKERTEGSLVSSTPEGTLDKQPAEVEVSDSARPQHAS